VARPEHHDRRHPQLVEDGDQLEHCPRRTVVPTWRCDTCTGLVTVNDDGTVTRNAEYYTTPSVEVRATGPYAASTSFGTTGRNGQIQDVAFRNPDGSTALISTTSTLMREPSPVGRRPNLRVHPAGLAPGDIYMAGF
jgi:hypothetical protein